MGYATSGKIGFKGRFDYGSVGTVANALCACCSKVAVEVAGVSKWLYGAE